ncbi:uncharacterized protein J3D65DRAFT_667194 [Phyllosticta citribraziliensis]|uniref:Uncharacterized protein n=1 Tax=Phyllosticta citribraziliensis TaxID=989973 RepID=A0ABR1LTL9_9PEZI
MPPKEVPKGNGATQNEKPSKTQFIKQNWGSYNNFLLSYGLKPDPDGHEEGNAILDAYEKQGAFETKN